MFFSQFIQMRNSPSIKYLCFHIICLGPRGHPKTLKIQYTHIFLYTNYWGPVCICSIVVCTSPRQVMGLPIITSLNNEKVKSEDKINGIDEQSALFCFRWYYFYYTCIICISSIFSFKSTENNAGFITFFLSCNGSENKSIYSPFFIL